MLPDGYTQREYLESDGNQYIDIGFHPSTNTRVVADVECLEVSGTKGFFGVRDTATSTAPYMYIAWVRTETEIRSDYFGSQVRATVESATRRVIIDKNKNTMKFGDDIAENDPASEVRTCENTMYIFGVNSAGNDNFYGLSMRLYSMDIYDNNQSVANFVPCVNSSGAAGLYDTVSGQFYGNLGTGSFTPGPEVVVADIPSGLTRRELFVDAKDLQSDSDPKNPLTIDEYVQVLASRGLEKLSDCQLVQSFEATVRTVNPTYIYGKDFFLGDTITVKDERVGVTVEAVVEGVERSVSRDGEDMVLTFGYSTPTLGEKLRKAGR